MNHLSAPSPGPAKARSGVARVLAGVAAAVGVLLMLGGLGMWLVPSAEIDPAESSQMGIVVDIGRSLRDDVGRLIAPAVSRVEKIAGDPRTLAGLANRTSAQQLCDYAIRDSTEIDAVALFDADGEILAINSIYANGAPIARERIDRVLHADYTSREIIQTCVRNDVQEAVLQFQTDCDITPALFDSTGLSVAYSVPIIDPKTGRRAGIVSCRLRFDRLTDLLRDRVIADRTGAAEFVTDAGGYFSEEINSGKRPPPVPSDVLAALVAPLVRGDTDFAVTRYRDEFLTVFRTTKLNTIRGGGLQVLLRVPRDWMFQQATWARSSLGIKTAGTGMLLLITAALLHTIARLQRTSRLALLAQQSAEGALSDAAAYRDAIDNHAVFAITDEHGRIVEVNDAFCRIAGYTRNELIGKRHTIMRSGEHPRAFWRAVYRTLIRGHIWRGELCQRAKDGSLHWMQTTIVPFTQSGGAIERLVVIQTDITGRKNQELRLADERAQLTAFVEQAPAAIAMLDNSMRYIAASRRWIEDFGVQQRRLIGECHYDVFPDMPESWREAHRAALKGRVRRHACDTWRPPNAEADQFLRWEVRPWYSSVEKDGTRRIGGIMIFAEDLTATMALQARAAEANERLEMALDAGGLGSWDWNVQTGSLRFDERFAAQLGLTAEEMTPQAGEWLKRVHPDDAPVARQAVLDHLEGRTPFYENEHRARHADGSWRWIFDRGRVVKRAEDGTPLRMVGTHTDITDRKIAEGRLSQTQKLESIGQLAAGIAHEINTPTQYVGDNTRFLQENYRAVLAALDRFESLLDTQASPQSWSERAEEMEKLAERLDLAFIKHEIPKAIEQSIEGLDRISGIIRAMRDFSHPGTGAMEATDINAAIQCTVTVCTNRWKYNAEVELDLAADLPKVPVLLNEFNQVILNLVINASDAIAEARKGDGRGTIRISTRQEPDWVVIEIADDGSGIPEAIRDRVFEPFFTTKGVGKGTGQGLSICHATIVRKHNGRIHFTTSAAGTTFTIRLPLRQQEAPALPQAA